MHFMKSHMFLKKGFICSSVKSYMYLKMELYAFQEWVISGSERGYMCFLEGFYELQDGVIFI